MHNSDQASAAAASFFYAHYEYVSTVGAPPSTKQKKALLRDAKRLFTKRPAPHPSAGGDKNQCSQNQKISIDPHA